LPVQAVALVLALAASARADEPVVTVLSDFDDDSVAVRIADVRDLAVSDCSISTTPIPARGQRALRIEIGATVPNASLGCGLRFRLAAPFAKADRVAAFCWIDEGAVRVAFRIRDARDRRFETEAVRVDQTRRWVRVAASLAPERLHVPDLPEGVPSPHPQWPIQIEGFRIDTTRAGRQVVYLDDLEVEHQVPAAQVVRAEFRFDHPTHLYEPGAVVRAAVVLENDSRTRALRLNVRLAWIESDGTVFQREQAEINLPASGENYRSRQAVDFSQRILEPGLYRLVARVRDARWPSYRRFETAIAVQPSNRALPRGRETFFGVRSNLLREPLADQRLELDLAREIGVQLLALECPWKQVEPEQDRFVLDDVARVVDQLVQRDIAVMLALTEPPDWLPDDAGARLERQARLVETLAHRLGPRVSSFEVLPVAGLSDADVRRTLQERLAAMRSPAVVYPPPVRLDGPQRGAALLQEGSPIVVQTAGPVSAAMNQLQRAAEQSSHRWTNIDRWLHLAAPRRDAGDLFDAFDVLRGFTFAARGELGGVLWFDLRDDTNDLRRLDALRGMVRRDYSPRMSLLGFASAVGVLHGLRYVGPVPGTPEEFDSALFIGGARQVAVLFPKPGRLLPATLTPLHGVEGEFTLLDFERRAHPILLSDGPPLVLTLPRPAFLVFEMPKVESDPQIALAPGWLRVPRTVLCGAEGRFEIQVDPPFDLRRSYLRVLLPEGAPLRSSFSARRVRAEGGQTLRFPVTLSPRGAAHFAPFEMTVRFWLEGQSLSIPVRVRPLTRVPRLNADKPPRDARYRVARLPLIAPEPLGPAVSDDQAQPALHMGFTRQGLHLLIVQPKGVAGDAAVRIGIVSDAFARPLRVRIGDPWRQPHIEALRADTSQPPAWRVGAVAAGDSQPAGCHVTIPANTLRLSALRAGQRLRLMVEVREAESPLFEARVWAFGTGLDAGGSAAEFEWIELGTPQPGSG